MMCCSSSCGMFFHIRMSSPGRHLPLFYIFHDYDVRSTAADPYQKECESVFKDVGARLPGTSVCLYVFLLVYLCVP